MEIKQLDLLAKSDIVIYLDMEDSNLGASSPSLNVANDTDNFFGGLGYASQRFGMNKPPAGVWKLTYEPANNPANLTR